MRERHRDIRSQLLTRDRVDLEDARTHCADALGSLEHCLVLGELIGWTENLGTHDLRKGVRHRRHRRQPGHLQRLVGALLTLSHQGKREQQKNSQKEARG